ncbi:phage tail-like protein [Cohnella sp. SGD-V74]|uniref:phage tail protein n=1 Tax=unclassified Cohnella TaxID=2636738 RepID=UPI000D480E1D|nr:MULTISPECIES: phage tail protein [unclassified Cohnella]PRX67825.1 phage tail-like protein [Cohnella sp. SGD-V74]
MSAAAMHHKVNGAFRFAVELDGMLVAGFSEAHGLESQIEYEEIREGGVNGYVHRLPKGVRNSTIMLKRGLSSSQELWNWYAQASQGTVTRKSGSIILYKQDGAELCRWNFFDAYPVKWSGPGLIASSSEVAIETIELVHNGVKAIFRA